MRSRAIAPFQYVTFIAACLAPLEGCSRWRVETLPPAQLVEQRHPGQPQVRRHDGERLVLKRPWVDGDSLAGLQGRDTSRVALVDVKQTAVRRFSLLQTAGLAIVTTGVTLGIACALWCDYEMFQLGQ